MGRDEWHQTGWWRVILPDGTLWMETSDSQEAQFGLIGDDGERHGHPDDARIQRLWQKTDSEWHDLNSPVTIPRAWRTRRKNG